MIEYNGKEPPVVNIEQNDITGTYCVTIQYNGAVISFLAPSELNENDIDDIVQQIISTIDTTDANIRWFIHILGFLIGACIMFWILR